MKQVVLLSMSLLLVANGYSLIGRNVKAEHPSNVLQKDEKVKIKKEELPEEAKKTLEGEAFKGWTVANSYKIKNGEYEVELRKGANAQSIKFDKDGKLK